MNRRQFGQSIAATVMGGALARSVAQVAGPAVSEPRFSCEIAMLKLPSFDGCIEVVAEAGYQGVELTGQSEEFVTRVTEHCRIAKGLECPQINIKSGKRLTAVDPNAQLQAAVDNLKRASDVAEASGINVVIEPIDLIENPPSSLHQYATALISCVLSTGPTSRYCTTYTTSNAAAGT